MTQIGSYFLQTMVDTKSQHLYGTQVITIAENETTASALTYVSRNILGTGRKDGNTLVTYGCYEDKLVLVAGVGWRVVEKVFTEMVSSRFAVVVGFLTDRKMGRYRA